VRKFKIKIVETVPQNQTSYRKSNIVAKTIFNKLQ